MIKEFQQTSRFLNKHAFASKHLYSAYLRWFLWQIKSRISPNRFFKNNFCGNSFLLAKKGMTGATGNIYAGLHEFNDMGFVLHYLDFEKVFFDVGANIGVYTILSASERGARTFTFEPIPKTFEFLKQNIDINKIHNVVTALNIGLGEVNSMLRFSENLDTINHVVDDGGIEVEVKCLNEFHEEVPQVMKIDVEGFELPLLKGADKLLVDDKLNAIIIELNQCGKRYGYSDQEIINLLEGHGFTMYDYDPFTRQLKDTDYSGDGNLIFIRDKKLAENTLKNAKPFTLWGEKI